MTSVPLEPEAYDCVAIVTNHSTIDYGDLVRRGKRDRRLPQRHQGPRGRRQGLEALTRGRRRRPQLLGAEPRSQLRRARRPRLALRPRRSPARRFAARYPQARTTQSFDELLADDSLDAVVIATPVPTHYALAKQALEAGQARLRREAAGDARRRDGRARAHRCRPRPRADARAPAPLPPGRREAEGADRRGRARRRALRLRQPRQPRHRPHERERALVARRARPVGDPLPARRGPRSRRRRRAARRSTPASRTSSSASCASRAGRSRTCTSRGSTRTRCGR